MELNNEISTNLRQPQEFHLTGSLFVKWLRWYERDHHAVSMCTSTWCVLQGWNCRAISVFRNAWSCSDSRMCQGHYPIQFEPCWHLYRDNFCSLNLQKNIYSFCHQDFDIEGTTKTKAKTLWDNRFLEDLDFASPRMLFMCRPLFSPYLDFQDMLKKTGLCLCGRLELYICSGLKLPFSSCFFSDIKGAYNHGRWRCQHEIIIISLKTWPQFVATSDWWSSLKSCVSGGWRLSFCEARQMFFPTSASAVPGGAVWTGQQVPPVSMEFQSLPMLVLELGVWRNFLKLERQKCWKTTYEKKNMLLRCPS